MSLSKVITRFPPSPTGFLHLGRARTALFNYIFAKQSKGEMVLRFEDTDSDRSKKEFENDMTECLSWLGIKYDVGPFWQSKRTDIYKKYLKKMIDDGFAYLSKEDPTEADRAEGRTRTEVIRFKNPNKKITFTDLIRGDITFDTTDLKDFVIARSVNEPLYHLAVVVDDYEMGITHIIRGEDGISNTPRQILIQEAIGAGRPLYAHLPLILAKDKSKLSGRHGAVSVKEYREKGYLPDALINYLALLGWNPGTEQEIFSLGDLIREFKIEGINKAGAIFNDEKLQWTNKEYIRKIPLVEQTKLLTKWAPGLSSLNTETLTKLTPLVFERISIFGEITQMFNDGEFDYLLSAPTYAPEVLLWKGKSTTEEVSAYLSKSIELLSSVSDQTFDRVVVKEAIWTYAESVGRGQLLWPMRYALSGREKSPDPFILSELLGKTETLKRLTHARDLLLKK